jgi:hypothetical protein
VFPLPFLVLGSFVILLDVYGRSMTLRNAHIVFFHKFVEFDANFSLRMKSKGTATHTFN